MSVANLSSDAIFAPRKIVLFYNVAVSFHHPWVLLLVIVVVVVYPPYVLCGMYIIILYIHVISV